MTQPPATPGPGQGPAEEGRFGPPPHLPGQPAGFGPPPPPRPAGFGPPPRPAGFGPPVPPPPGGFGPPEPPVPPRRSARRRTVLVVASVAALALLAGGGAWYVVADGDGGDGGRGTSAKKPGPAYAQPKEVVPADPKATFTGGAPVPKLPKGEDYWPVNGSWLTDEVYAKASVQRITGLDAGTGKVRWTLEKPGQSCAGSREIGTGGIAVVVTAPTTHGSSGNRAPCTEVMAFELATGKKLWATSLKIGYQRTKTEFNQVVISGRTVAVAGLYGGAAFDLRTGEPRWKPRAGETCQDVGYGGGARLVAVRRCGEYGSETYRVQDLDPVSGKPRWSHKLPAGVTNLNVLSTDPVVVGLDSGEVSGSGATDVFALDRRGRLRSKTALPDRRYLHNCGSTSVVNDCRGIVVGNDKLYVPTARRDGSKRYSSTNDLVAFALSTGRLTGPRGNAHEGAPMFPIRMDGGNVIAYRDYGGVEVVTLDGRTMKEKRLLTARGRPSGMLAVSSETLYAHGRLYVSSTLLAKPRPTAPKEMMMYAYARNDDDR
ncbi:PQQ-binding-like beta-propeller repeat protein [Streptomyces longispororuber]|uniref:outer membrane protein assembly factor BamB family protein n=1 Tax=Streptomyces longispororuber TaxID=68230 RepID=UPI00340853D6